MKASARASAVSRRRSSSGGGGNAASKWFDPASYINVKVPTAPAIDQNSASLISGLSNGGATSIFANGTSSVNGDGASTVYHTDGSQTLRTITLSVPYNGQSSIQVPIDSSWVVGPTDGHMIVIDDRDGNYWEFQALNTSTWHANGVARAHPSGSSIYTADGVSFGTNNHVSGLPVPNGMIRPEDISAGVIDHGLRTGFFYTSAGFQWPAWGSDGSHSPGIPMGAHLWLPRSVSISGLTTYQQMVAKALQEYGLWVGDSGGGCAIYCESTLSGITYPFSSLSLPNSILSQMQVLMLNKITNASFETDASGWSTGSNFSIARDTSKAYAGSASLKCTSIGTGQPTSIGWKAASFTGVSLVANQTHQLFAYLFIPSSWNSGSINVSFWDFAANIEIAHVNANLSIRDQWQQVILSVTPSIAYSNSGIRFSSGLVASGNGDNLVNGDAFWIDNVYLGGPVL